MRNENIDAERDELRLEEIAHAAELEAARVKVFTLAKQISEYVSGHSKSDYGVALSNATHEAIADYEAQKLAGGGA